MAGLLDQAADNPIGGLMSLLSPIVTGGAVTPPRGQLLSSDQIDQSTPGWLAFARSMANAGAPTLGPPVTFGQALTGAMGAGYSAERQQQMLPLLLSAAQREQDAGQLALEQTQKMNPLAVSAAVQAQQEKALQLQRDQFQFDRDKLLFGVEKGIVTRLGGEFGTPPGAGGTGPAGGTQTPAGTVPGTGPRSDLGPPAGAAELAALPEVGRLPEQTRIPFMQAVAQVGMPLPVAAQYARMLPAEGQGLHINPKTGQPWVSDAGAVGAAQVMPGTFRDMQNKYGFAGNLTDLMPNLVAGGHYLMDQVSDHGMHGGVIAYNAGPRGLERYLASGKLPAETADYLAKTGAPGANGLPAGTPATTPLGPRSDATAPGDLAPPTLRPVQVAGPGAPTEAEAPPPPGLNLPGPPALERDPLSGAMVPGEVLKTARAAVLTPGPAGSGIAAYNKVIHDYVASLAQQPTGRILTPDEVKSYGGDPRVQMFGKFLPDGRLAGMEPLGGRNPLQQLQQEQETRGEYLGDPTVKAYNQALPYLQRMTALIAQVQKREPSAADDMALLKNYAHLNDPNAVVKSGDEHLLYESAGIPGDLKQMWSRVVGGDRLLPEQRNWLLESARGEMGGQEAAAYQVLLEKRRIAQGAGLRPDQIAIPWKLSNYAQDALSATPEGAARPGEPTAPTGQSDQIPRPGVMVPATALPGARELAPPAAPAAPAPAGPATGPPAAKDRFTAEQWKGFTPAGLANIADDMVKNPGHYSVADRQHLLEEGKARKAK